MPISFCSSIEHYDLLQIHSCSLEKNTLSHRQAVKDLKDTVVPQSYHETREMAQPIKGSSCKHEDVINPECSLRARYSSVCSAGARDWPASLAISELQVWREASHLKIRRRFTRDYSTSSYHLPVAPQLGALYPSLWSMLGFYVAKARACTCCLNGCDFLGAATLLCTEDTVSLYSSTTSCSWTLSVSSPSVAPEPREEGHTSKST